ncbi:alkaline phosphatase family protein [Tropicimonas sp. TH_r6]|uniref:alkaline phosphatase family protein n=1 Tax=Tropicimonas sp. TH_r6 TaxID=3082085 RepID=UPI0029535DEA|nr:alkaline phosphatase family protein [Tropicimonas sp. TH_r6]MDV7145682.1 alkaline phosphatase family protein [Tropicimonas sp. TH_r6]
MHRALPILLACSIPLQLAAQPDIGNIRLIVQLTVDGMRGDLLTRYRPSFGPDGFNRLLDSGVWYTNAHHLHANTETIVGHATLATGAHPSEHGMVGNVWLNRATGKLGYNIEDPKSPILPVPGFGGDGEQLDPAQAIAQAGGRSPVNLLATTFADELVKSNNGRSKVFAVSGKDRSAVAMAGHVGKAFWYSTTTGAFETSRYYYDDYPTWALDWNAARPADAATGTSWALSGEADSYLLAANDDRPYEVDLKGFGRTFPHAFGTPDDGIYYSQVLVSPLGDELAAEFAKTAVTAEGLGRDSWPDLLSVSFSSVDAVNHFFGPSSLENEEIVRRLDRTLAEFMQFLDEEVGSDHILYVLSADHGMPEMPEFVAEQGFTVERNTNQDLQEELNAEIAETHGIEGAVNFFFRPYIYLNHKAIAEAGASVRDIEEAISLSLEARDGIAIAMPREPLPEQRGDFLEAPIRRNFHPQRSGDIYVAQAPYSFLFDHGSVAVMHGSPWRYDTHVPIIFAGSGIEPARIARPVATVDVAPTLSDLFGTTVPSGAAGEPLFEAIR